ncbi:MAG: BspA family leucine-rich repeat surface protein, partial [Marinifilaceae bacterium]|nr:BspA family leucine-rich repeat surface protein [Marinifilaceae bacterium]
FNTPQKYTVTAEDGSKTVYTVTIANKIEPETEIYAFSIQEYSAEISANKIYLELPYGTDLTNLKPEISINKDASISPEIGLAQDFTKPVYYTVFSQNGSETIYEVCVVNSKNTKAHIISFVINGKHAEIIDENIELELEYGVDLSSLSPHIEISEAATISPASDVEQDFTNDVKYVVKAEDGSENEFIVNIVNKANHEAKINSFEINGKKAEIFGTEIDLELDYDADLENLSPVIKISDGASIYPESGKQIDFREQVVYTVTSAYGNKTKYKVNITVDQLLVYDETHRSVKINNKYNDKIKIGQTIMFQGLKYTVVDRAKLKSMIKNGGQQKLERLVTSRITNMDEIFRDKKIFNANISHWDVSNVKSMKGMFYNAKHFNADIGKWDVSNVTNMSLMFRDAGKFNKDISGWDVSKLTNMAEMFRNAKSFNADIGKWNVSNVTNMSLMFRDAEKFNQDIGGWNVSNVTNMNEMFRNAKNFNIYIGDWNVSKVTHMDKMFYQAKIFGQNLSGWNVVNVLHYNCVFVMTNMQGNQYPKWNHK